MDYLIILCLVATVTLCGTQAKNLASGPQVLNDTSKLQPQSSQKRYATKEIILYLTPSQIRALQEGQGIITQQNPHVESELQANAYAHAQAQAIAQQHLPLPPPAPLKAAPVEEPHSDHFVPITPPPEYRHLDNYAYINFHPPNNPHIPKPIQFIPEPHELAPLSEPKLLPTLIPHDALHQKSLESQGRDYLKEQWYRLLEQNRAQLKALAALSHLINANEHNKGLLQYAPKYNDQKYALEHLIDHSNQQLQLEKQHALLQAEAIANSPPVVVHKEINIKHSPVHLIKQVKVPVPTPVLIPVPEPFEVKVPQPYPVPLEIIKPVPFPILKSQKIEIERQVPIELGKPLPLIPVTRNPLFNVDRPYFLKRAVPSDVTEHKTGSVPTNSQVWKH